MRSIIGLVGVLGLVSGMAGALAYDQLGSDAGAAPPPPSATQVREQNLDGSGFIRVHEQGTADVAGTVNVGNLPTVQDVNVVSGGPAEYTQFIVDVSGGTCPNGGQNADAITQLNAQAQNGYKLVSVEALPIPSGGCNQRLVYTLERPQQ